MSGKTIGYARTATTEQDITRQIEALKAAGCTEIFSDSGSSGMEIDRPGFSSALKALGPDDVLVVCTPDRISRSLSGFHQVRRQIYDVGARIECLDIPADERLIQNMAWAVSDYNHRLADEASRKSPFSIFARLKHWLLTQGQRFVLR